MDERDIAQVALAGRDEASLTAGERNYLRVHGRRYGRTLALLPEGNGRRLLDVGCFPGHLALLTAARGWRVSGVSTGGARGGDPSFEKRMAAAGIETRTVDIEREKFPWDDGTFDGAMFNETIEHLAYNPFHPLSEIWRVLRPGGLLILSVPNAAGFDKRWALLRGRSLQLDLRGPMSDVFPADLSHRHIREYTPSEVRWLLTEQDRYLYEFRIERFVMDRSWDGMFCRSDGYAREWRRIRPGTVLRDLLTRWVPSLRGNILVLARKPEGYVRLGADGMQTEGFLAPETTGTGPGFVRAPIRAAWMGGEAEIRLRCPAGRVAYVDLLMLVPAPDSVPPRRVTFRCGEEVVLRTEIAPSCEPRRVRVPVNRSVPAGEWLRIRVASDTWQPVDYGLTGDRRTLGVMVSPEEAGVGCPTREARDPL